MSPPGSAGSAGDHRRGGPVPPARPPAPPAAAAARPAPGRAGRTARRRAPTAARRPRQIAAPVRRRSLFSSRLISSQLRLTSSAPETVTSANTCGCRRTSLATIPSATSSIVYDGAVVALGGDAGVEHDLQQHVAEFLAEGLLVAGLQGLEGLIGLLEQVRRERFMGLAGIPRAFRAQPVHGHHQVHQVRAGQVGRSAQRAARQAARHRRLRRAGQPHHRPWAVNAVHRRFLATRYPIPASSSAGSCGWPAGASTSAADRRACHAAQLSSPGATRGLVTRTVSKPASAPTAMPSAPALRAATPCWARRRPGPGCSLS